jgi:hypothetical protein
MKYAAGAGPSGMTTAVVVAFKGVGLLLSLTA